ncbi:hypothetical protein LC605_32115 [Nostoc sp. CHAB 5836]|uniref:hypothetical protein n=1 Tax=Nostoc sp. CHAB 5836 TaxID=2780404 RepID=UPI001E5CDF89|nr:hypothetical protein [Nostoc sp. CHAB 5836]MCC5619612.1 hypothetical protein [Nostoc sp. CHAB 5836]
MSIRICPGSPYFADRSSALRHTEYALKRSNAVLLYGGRQAGKTAFLRRLHDFSLAQPANVADLSSYELFIYVDLSRLLYDATPADFYRLLYSKTLVACKTRVIGFVQTDEHSPDDLDSFVIALLGIATACRQVDVRFIFLLDEAKRVLGTRFPRGFQDNLFSLLFGEAGEQLKIAMVFAGNQHLDEFLKDDTSPIGSRSLSVSLSNLAKCDVQELIARVNQELVRSVDVVALSEKIIPLTGGHAGLTARLVERAFAGIHASEPDSFAGELASNSEVLFENWILVMSPEARELIAYFATTKSITVPQLADRLAKRNLNKYLARRVFDEYEYTGIGLRVGDELIACNSLFWDYAQVFKVEDVRASDAETVWSLIERTELALRQLVLQRLNTRFGQTTDDRMRKVLGDKSWEQIVATQEKSKHQYRYARESSQRDLMSCMYLGQLGMLMTNGATWDLFKNSFRDKRELEDKLACIMPVRNDRAHFTPVPSKELDRCRIACDDLLTIAERELDELGNADVPTTKKTR